MVYVGGAMMSALDAATGHLRWRYRSGPGYTVPPLLAAGAAYAGYVQFGAGAGQPGRATYRVYAMDPVNGQVRWAYPARQITTPMAASPGMVFAGSVEGVFSGAGEEVFEVIASARHLFDLRVEDLASVAGDLLPAAVLFRSDEDGGDLVQAHQAGLLPGPDDGQSP
jgi:outer membrane protein assembly factor BamB